MKLPCVHSVDLQIALVNECYDDEKDSHPPRTGIVGSGYRGVFDVNRLCFTETEKPRKSQLNNTDLHSCLYHLVQTARFRAKDYLSRGVVLV